MTQAQKTGLILNIVPVTFSKDRIKIGRIAYQDEDAYSKLREEHWQTHAFRYDARTKDIANVALSSEVVPLGKVEEVEIKEHLLLAAKAVQQSILLWIANKLSILKAGKKLVFWGQADTALLLSQALTKNELQPVQGLEVAVRHEIDCRMFLDPNDTPFLGLVLDVGVSNIIDIPVLDLINRGLQVVDKYVCRRKSLEQSYLRPGLELVGRIVGVKDSTLLLTDTEGITEINASDALLEPRAENLQEVIEKFFGSKSAAILTSLKNLRQPLATAMGKLDRIRSTLVGLRKHRIIIGDGVEVTLSDLLQAPDPLFPVLVTTDRPTLLFGAQGRNTGQIPDPGIATYGPYMYMQHTRNAPVIAVVCEARLRGRVEQFLKSLETGFPEELWTNPKHGNPFKDSFKQLRGNDNPYFVAKSELMKAGVPVQSVCIENIESGAYQVPYILNNVALAIYAKLDGIPWVISTRGPTAHELVIGLRSAEVATGRLQAKTKYVGITTVFQGDGRYVVWGLTREAVYEEYLGALLESLRTAVTYVRERNGWQPGDRVRLVCHVYKRLKDCEVDAIKSLVQELVTDQYSVEFAFLDISWWHPYQIFDPAQRGRSYGSGKTERLKGKGIPERGVCMQLDKTRGLLHLTGPSDVKTEDQGLPQPLLVELHSDSSFTDMTYLLRQIYHFVYMSWQTFFPATEPVTIKYSYLIARLLGNLNLVTGWDSTVLSVGSLQGRRWFL